MRVLLMTSKMSQALTDKLDKATRDALSPDVGLDSMTAEDGLSLNLFARRGLCWRRLDGHATAAHRESLTGPNEALAHRSAREN